MLNKIDHLGIAVKDLKTSVNVLASAFGLEARGFEKVPSQQVEVAFIPVGKSTLELLEPTSDESAVAKFLANRGEGFHHLAFETDSIEATLKAAENAGMRLIDKQPRPGAHGTKVAFIHPKSTFGVLIELVQKPD